MLNIYTEKDPIPTESEFDSSAQPVDESGRQVPFMPLGDLAGASVEQSPQPGTAGAEISQNINPLEALGKSAAEALAGASPRHQKVAAVLGSNIVSPPDIAA